MGDFLLRLAVGLFPVLLFLAALIYLDSYKLVRLRSVLAAIAAGGLVAGVCFLINAGLLSWTGWEIAAYSRYVAPVLEEIAKGALLVYLIRSNRVGFLVDAAIFGFAVGTGFAVIENLVYLKFLEEAHLAVWIVRGLGTAIMHGGTMALFAIVSRT